MRVGDFFRNEPETWGLRGDQYLWHEFAKAFADTPVPESKAELERMLETAFWEATGCSLSFCSEVLVDRLAKEKSIRGGVSGAMWRYRFFPMIIRRSEEARGVTAA